jgi:GNAT superfamily N-acetyltransferase
MPIRHATLQDLDGLTELGRRMHALTRFKHLEFSAQRLKASLAELISHGRGKAVVLAAEDAGGRVVGVLIGVLERHIFSDQLMASIMHFDVLPECRMGGYGVRLLRAFELWAANRKVVEVSFGVNSGEHLETVGRFARRMGYGTVGENYVKHIA